VRTIKIAGRLRKIQEFLREKNVGRSRKRGNQERERKKREEIKKERERNFQRKLQED